LPAVNRAERDFRDREAGLILAGDGGPGYRLARREGRCSKNPGNPSLSGIADQGKT